MAKFLENLFTIVCLFLFYNWVHGSDSDFKASKSAADIQEFNYSQYETVSGQALIDYLETNAAAANRNLKGKNVRITGCKISRIDSDGDNFFLTFDNKSFSFSNLQCWVKKNSIAQKQLLNLAIGQPVDVYGKITRVGDTLGYDIDTYRIELPNQTSTNNSTNKPAKKSTISVNDTSEVRDVMNNFIRAYVLRDHAKMAQYSFYPEQQFSKADCYDLMDNQTKVFDELLEIYSEYQKKDIPYKWSVENIKRLNNDTCSVDVNLIIVTDTLRYYDIQVRKINGVWLVNGESFAISSSSSTVSAFVY